MMRNLFFNDWIWKLFSLFLAAAIWLTVRRTLGETPMPVSASNASTTTYRNLPVTLVSSTGDVRGFRLLQSSVSVTVSGPTNIIDTLQANQLRANIDLSSATNVSTEKQHVEVSVPPGVTFIYVSPETIGVLPPP